VLVRGLCVVLTATAGVFPANHLASKAHVATTTVPVVATTTTVAPPTPPPLVSPEIMAKWERVNQCEEGGNWHVQGSLYSGGLGITNYNWIRFGGGEFAWNAADATPEEQVVVARRIQAHGGVPDYVPDQWGCGHGW